MLEQVHFASQYLAMAGKSFLESKADDSHTNIGYNIISSSFETWDLNDDGLKLTLYLSNFQLKWSTGQSLVLSEKTHNQVVQWLKATSSELGLEKNYHFNLHYDLPFDWDEDYSYELIDESYLVKEAELRTLANKTLETFLRSQSLKSDIRIWPHHFDTGAFMVLDNGSGKSIGMGMAIPDWLMNDHYFYLSGYNGHDAIDTSNFSSMTLGEWKNKGFKGAVFPTSGIAEKEGIQFLKEAFAQYN